MYKAAQDPYCYAGTSLLKNKWDIQNQSDLAEVEAMFAQQRMMELYLNRTVTGRFGFAHLKKIHHYIFQDVYTWAGKVRTVRISKGNSMFAYPEYIVPEGDRIFGLLRQEQYLTGLGKDSFIVRSAWYIGEINTLHPFREGNGRTLRVFMWLLGIRNGWEFQFENMDGNEWLNACIASYDGNYKLLESLLAEIIKELEI